MGIATFIARRHRVSKVGATLSVGIASGLTVATAQEAPIELPPVEVSVSAAEAKPKKKAPAKSPAPVQQTMPDIVSEPAPALQSQVPGTVFGSAPADYPGGQIARGGQVGLRGNMDFMDTPFTTVSYTE